MKPVDYNTYDMTRREYLLYSILCAGAIYACAFVFYRSHALSLLLSPLALLYPNYRKKELIAKQKEELKLQFKDMLYSLSSTLSAGRPVEAAFRELHKDLEIIYPDPDTSILKEIGLIIRKLEMNEPVEAALSDFAARAHLDDIWNFADVFQISKRTGGNMIDVIRNTSNIINDKIEIRQEIDTILAERRFERKILNLLPVLLLIIISATAGDYMEPVFSTPQGRLVITIAVVLLFLAYIVSKKVMDIRV